MASFTNGTPTDSTMHHPATTDEGHLSPALRQVSVGKSPTAYEIKFLLSEDLAREVEKLLLRSLLPDPHADPALGGMYAITSLACDAPDFPVFFRDPCVRNRKYRVRRYGASDVLYLERKRSKDGKVRKRRVEAATSDLAALAQGHSDRAGHAWFVREVQASGLAPICVMRYLRRALFGVSPEGPMRVTFDRAIRGALIREWSLDASEPERSLFSNVVVCEFKFQTAMPSPMKAALSALSLQPTACSKYRTCVREFAPELGLDLSSAPSASDSGVTRA